MTDRQKANLALVEKLRAMVLSYPDMRFGQLLMAYGFVATEENSEEHYVDPFYEEPQQTLERVEWMED